MDVRMKRVGFVRSGDRYVHPSARFYVEFPRGPLAIGRDDAVKPASILMKGRRVLALSATDS